jgi:Kef-type K+ transport system membrane component KefB
MTAAHARGNPVAQLFILALLVGGVIALYYFVGSAETGTEIRIRGVEALLAFGFVVLASYTIGQLVDVVRLPHITGYLLAGLLLGPSAAHFVGQYVLLPAPFDRGILHGTAEDPGTLQSLGILKTLAIALIALTAGGELRLDGLRRGLRSIAGLLAGHTVVVFTLATVAAAFALGPLLSSLGAAPLDLGQTLAVAVLVGTVTTCVSPAVTIAVTTELRSEGPVTRTLLAAVVLQDVVIVVAFSLASVLAASALGLTADRDLGPFLLRHIGGSLVAGTILGGLLSLYLRFVNRELMLVIVGVVYGAALLCTALHLDPLLLFIAAGFTVGNFSRRGDQLIHTVEQLSGPVYVVFFTLAGAELHLEALAASFPFAIGLTLLRGIGIRFGVVTATRLFGAPEVITKYAWLGMVSQAGVALSIAALVKTTLGPTGEALSTFLIACIALNELAGPVLFKAGLSFAGEIGKKGTAVQTTDSSVVEEPAPATEDESPSALGPWPVPDGDDPWGKPPELRGEELEEQVLELRRRVRAIETTAIEGPIARTLEMAESFVADIRREFLRAHRRIATGMRAPEQDLAALVHAEESQLALAWRDAVLARATAYTDTAWQPNGVVEELDRLAEEMPEWFRAPYEAESYERASGLRRGFSRLMLRIRRAFLWIFRTEPRRRVPFRALVRYHLAGSVPVEFEKLAVLLVRTELHFLRRTQALVESLIAGYESLLRAPESGEDAEERLRALRARAEEQLEDALADVRGIARAKSAALSRTIAGRFDALVADLRVAGTIDFQRRRSGRVLHQRLRAVQTLTDALPRVRQDVAGNYRLLAMDLELIGLEARAREAMRHHLVPLARMTKNRTVLQAKRIEEALSTTLPAIEAELDARNKTGEAMAIQIRALMVPLEKVTEEATAIARTLYEEVAEQGTVEPLLDAVRKETLALSEQYEVPARPLEERKDWLPEVSPSVEVPFRELVQGYFEGSIALGVTQEAREFASAAKPLVASLEEIDRLVRFKSELAAAELDAIAEEIPTDAPREVLREMLIAGFERNRDVARRQAEEIEHKPDELIVELEKKMLAEFATLRAQLMGGELSRVRLDVMRRRAAGQRLMRRAESIPALVRRTGKFVITSVRSILGAERLDVWWQRLGLPEDDERPVDAPLFAAPPIKSELPVVYRRLFVADALDLKSTREDEIHRARSVLATRSHMRAVALIGAEGVGKGALTRAIVRSKSFRVVRRIVLSKPVDEAEVAGWFEERPADELTVVSGFHWLVSTQPGGFAPLRRLVEGVVADRGRTSWLVSADAVVWDFARRAASIEEAFGELVRVAPLDRHELEAVVLARHQLSGYRLDFEAPIADSAFEDFLVRGADRIRRPYDAYFRALRDSSGGLVREALHLWLASIDEIDERAGIVRVGAVPRSPQSALRRLPDDVLYALLQVARQGWIDARTFAYLYREDAHEAEARIARLERLGLLAADGDAFIVAPHLRGPAVRVLRERGWV